jgi:site-specific recombinase XerD
VFLLESEEILEKDNSYIKIIAAGTGVKKNITTHTGRQTFATYLLNRNVPMEFFL